MIEFCRLVRVSPTRCDCITCGRPVAVHPAAKRPPQVLCIATAGESTPEAPPRQCASLGPELRREQCPSCSGHVQIKVFACATHGECTIGQPIDGLACCSGCASFRAE